MMKLSKQMEDVIAIVNTLEEQVTSYRHAYRLAPDYRMTVVFPVDETMRDTYEKTAPMLEIRGIDIDWAGWPPRENTPDQARKQGTVEFLLFPKGSFVTEPGGYHIDLTAGYPASEVSPDFLKAIDAAAQDIRNRHRLTTEYPAIDPKTKAALQAEFASMRHEDRELYEPDPDDLTRAELAEYAHLPWSAVAETLDEWLSRMHGITSSNHNAGAFLDFLAMRGYRVTAIPESSLDTLLGAPTE